MENPLLFLTGKVIPALYTPFRSDRQQATLAKSELRKLVLALRDVSLDTLYLLGTTGQGMELTAEFRKDMLTHFISYLPRSLKLIVHVGAKTTEEAVELASHAAALAKINSDRIIAVSAKPPKGMNYEEEIEYHREIRRHLGKLPYVAYFIGDSLSVPVSRYVSDLITLGAVAVKFTSHDMVQLKQLVEFGGEKLLVFSGEDTLVLEAQKLGAFACIGSTYNWSGDWVQRVRDAQVAAEAGIDFTAFSQTLSSVVRAALTERNSLPHLYAFSKHAITLRWGAKIGDGVDPQFLPVPNLDDEFITEQLAKLEAATS